MRVLKAVLSVKKCPKIEKLLTKEQSCRKVDGQLVVNAAAKLQNLAFYLA